MQRFTLLLFSLMAVGAVLATDRVSADEAQKPGGEHVILATKTLHYAVSADGTNLAFTDRATGNDYAVAGQKSPLVRIRIADRWHPSASAKADGNGIVVGFADSDATVTLGVTVHPRHLVLEVIAASDGIDELQLLNLSLALKGELDEPFAACVLALNLQTNVPGIPGPSSRLTASCVRRFGVVGAAVAVVGSPMGEFRDALKEAVTASKTLPQSPVGGPWAMDAPINRASYLFAVPTEDNVEEIIRTLKSIGFNQVQIHGGRGTYRFGDCMPNPKLYPNGVASMKAVIDRLHEEDIYAGMHPYAFFIDKTTPWVTPIPNPGLASGATFTLAADLPADADVVSVQESTEAVSTITGFFERNSVTLRIGEELITFGGIAKEPPYAFTQCKRGALGTTASAHRAGEKAYQLKECFGLFVPDPDSPLFTEVIEANARFFNECGFDTLYQDALDGEDVLGGRENSWHYGSKYIWELWKRLKRPAAMEYSTFHHHLWVLRSRHGAWDHPTRAHQQFIDQHVAANRNNDRMFLPSNLGWWSFKTWQPPQVEPTFPEDIEYWSAKALGTDSGLSLQGYNPSLPGHQRLAAIVKQYEGLRHAGVFSESVKARLREPGAAYTLTQSQDGAWQFRPVRTTRQKVQGTDERSNRWTVRNAYGSQTPFVRIEAMMSTGPYDAEGNVTLAGFTEPEDFAERASAAAVQASMTLGEDEGGPVGHLEATNSGQQRRGTWASFKKTFDPPLKLTTHQGLGVWIRGDGKGEVLNFQLQSPSHITRARAERYVIVDFEGWRYFELVELDADRYTEFGWPYPGGYSIYREQVHYGVIESLTVWCNHLPAKDSISVDLRPVRALPLLTGKLVNPRLAIGQSVLDFPAEISSGRYLEVNRAGTAQLYGPAGEPLGSVVPTGELGKLRAGREFSRVPMVRDRHSYGTRAGFDGRVRRSVSLIGGGWLRRSADLDAGKGCCEKGPPAGLSGRSHDL